MSKKTDHTNLSWSKIYKSFYFRYEKVIDDNSSVHVSHPVTNYEFFYEPFYISLDNVPPYDERFVGYGFTRNTQVQKGILAVFNYTNLVFFIWMILIFVTKYFKIKVSFSKKKLTYV